MAEDNKNIKVNIIKKSVSPDPVKKAPEEVVEKKPARKPRAKKVETPKEGE